MLFLSGEEIGAASRAARALFRNPLSLSENGSWGYWFAMTGLVPPQDDIIRLHVPVDGPQVMEHPQGPAELRHDLSGLLRREQRAFQQEVQ